MIASRSMHRDSVLRMCAVAFAAALVMGRTAAPAYADPITDDNVVEAVSAAKTPADHQALAAYFSAKAATATAQAGTHSRLASSLQGKGRGAMRMHCNGLERTYKEQAKDYAALAKEQEALAEGE